MEEVPSKSYSKTAKALHWAMAVLIIAMLLTGSKFMGGHNVKVLPSLHVTIGFLLLALVAYRLYWRRKNQPPELPGSMTSNARLAAKLSHLALYAAMVLLPLAGWLAYTEHVRRSMGVQPANFLWLFDIPLLPDFGVNFHFIHRWGGRAFLALIAIHALAALKHHFYDKDDVLRRMVKR